MILTKSAPGRVEFHVSRKARDKYQFDNTLFSATGNVIFADFQAALVFTQKMNAARDLELHPEAAVHAAQVNAMGLIDDCHWAQAFEKFLAHVHEGNAVVVDRDIEVVAGDGTEKYTVLV